MRGDQLLEQIRRGGNGATINDLLDEFFGGYPLTNLRLLLFGETEAEVKAGAWIASELGARVAPLLEDLRALLQHPLPYVRFFVLEAFLLAGTREHGGALAEAIRLIDDGEGAVRRKAMALLAHATREQLESSLVHLEEMYARLVRWLLDLEDEGAPDDVVSRLSAAQPVERRFAAAAAGRMRQHATDPLAAAATSTDEDIRVFATQELRKFGGKRSN